MITLQGSMLSVQRNGKPLMSLHWVTTVILLAVIVMTFRALARLYVVFFSPSFPFFFLFSELFGCDSRCLHHVLTTAPCMLPPACRACALPTPQHQHP